MPGSGVVKPDGALQLLKDGNKRFTGGTAVAGKITPSMRRLRAMERVGRGGSRVGEMDAFGAA